MDDPFTEFGSGMLEENSTWAGSCAASSLQAANGSGLPPSIDIAVRVSQIFITIFRTILGVTLNGLIVALIVTSKELKNISSVITIQIASVNVVLTVVFSSSVVNNIAGQWILGLDVCIASGFLIVLLSHVRNNLVIAFALERFALVFFPFHYPKYRRRVVAVLCASSWFLSLVNSVLLLPPLLDCYEYWETIFCSYSLLCNDNCLWYHTAFLTTHIAPAIFIPAVCFTAIYAKWCKIRFRGNRQTREEKGMSDQDWRALKTFLLLLLPSLLMTYIVPLVASRMTPIPSFVWNYLMQKLGLNAMTATVLADAIIILRNGDVRDALKTMVKGIKEKFMK